MPCFSDITVVVGNLVSINSKPQGNNVYCDISTVQPNGQVLIGTYYHMYLDNLFSVVD